MRNIRRFFSLAIALIVVLQILNVFALQEAREIPIAGESHVTERFVPTPVQYVNAASPRNINFNNNWQFHLATRLTERTAAAFRDNGLPDPAGGPFTDDIIQPGFDDSAWRTLDVPHCWSIEGARVTPAAGATDLGSSSSTSYMQGGLGWYRKTFHVTQDLQDAKDFIIDFEGVYQNSIVYVNGKVVGNYPSGYTGFAYDISEFLEFGADANDPAGVNVIVVKVQNASPSGRWFTGSGIHRPVTLMVVDKTHFARHGIVITNNEDLEKTWTGDKSAQLTVTARINGRYNGLVQLRTTVIDHTGAVVATHTTREPKEINPNTMLVVTESFRILNVRLWDMDDPYRYVIRNEIIFDLNGGPGPEATDAVDIKYGFRWFRIDVKEGFFLNAKYHKIKGTDLHHDSGALGGASYYDAFRRQMEILKSMGVNSYRSAHNPPAREMIEVCNDLGIVVLEEAYDGWGAPKAQNDFGLFFLLPVPDDFRGLGVPRDLFFDRTQIPQGQTPRLLWSDWVIREMTLRHINEPSVIMWSIGNEVGGVGTRPAWYDWRMFWRGEDNLSNYAGPALDLYARPAISATTINHYTEALRLRNNILDLDPTRYIVTGEHQYRTPPGVTSTWGLVAQAIDGIGLNYNSAWSVDRLIEVYANLGRRGTFFFESESSSQTAVRGKYYSPQMFQSAPDQTPGNRGSSSYDNNFASWTMPNEYGLKKDRDRKAFIGQYIWVGMDYLGEPTPYGVFPVGVSNFGCIDLAGFPKDAYWLYRGQWTDFENDPMIHIMPMNWTDWREGEIIEVWIYTNAGDARLYLNGRDLGPPRAPFERKTANYSVDGKPFEYWETTEITNDNSGSAGSGGTRGSWGVRGTDGIPQHPVNFDGYYSNLDPEGNGYGKLHLTWDVPFEPGTLRAVALNTDGSPVVKDGVIIEDVLRTADEAHTFTMKPDRDYMYLDENGTSLIYIEVDVVDAKFERVPSAKNLVRFDIEGPAMIFGVDNGATESRDLYKWSPDAGTGGQGLEKSAYSQRQAWMGKILVIIKAERGADTADIKITASSDGMVPATLTIPVSAIKGIAPPGRRLEISRPPLNAAGTAVAAPRTVQALAGVPVKAAALPKDVAVIYPGGVTLNQRVTWNEIAAASFGAPGKITINGVFEDPALANLKPTIMINVIPMIAERENIAQNTRLVGNDSPTITTIPNVQLTACPEGVGPVATASFTSGTNYPNHMINGSGDDSFWENPSSSATTAVHRALTYARANDTVQVNWPDVKNFDKVSLYFLTPADYDIPRTITVRYWDGFSWLDAQNQVLVKATESDQETSIVFDPVISSRVRVFMENAQPLAESGGGRIRINRMEVSWGERDEGIARINNLW